ncbi:MAG: citrate/2-methylcitrate synthase, partial [Acidimicrobiales bacterium]
MTTTTDELIDVPPGLKGVAVTETALGDVRGRQGYYHYRQYSATELAGHRPIEDVWQLLLDGRLPDTLSEREAFAAEVRPLRDLPAPLLDVLPSIAAAGGVGLDAVRSAVSILATVDGMRPLWGGDPGDRRRDLLRLAAVVPTIVAG